MLMRGELSEDRHGASAVGTQRPSIASSDRASLRESRVSPIRARRTSWRRRIAPS